MPGNVTTLPMQVYGRCTRLFTHARVYARVCDYVCLCVSVCVCVCLSNGVYICMCLCIYTPLVCVNIDPLHYTRHGLMHTIDTWRRLRMHYVINVLQRWSASRIALLHARTLASRRRAATYCSVLLRNRGVLYYYVIGVYCTIT